MLDGVDDDLAEAAREEAGLHPAGVGCEVGGGAAADPVGGSKAGLDVEALPGLHEGIGERIIGLGRDPQEDLLALEGVDAL